MANDIKLQEGQTPVDQYLRPIKVGGKATAIEIAQHGNGAKINGNLNIDGDIGLSGSIFSSTDSVPSYSGMILGYTQMDYGTTSAYYGTTTSFAVITTNHDHGDGAEDHYLGIEFIVPPSNKVEIEVYLPYCSAIDGTLSLGLATATDATTLGAKYSRQVWDVDETDLVGIVTRWYVDGSDVSWSAGDFVELYCMAKEGTAGGRLFFGDGFVNYGDMMMKATALPDIVGDGT